MSITYAFLRSLIDTMTDEDGYSLVTKEQLADYRELCCCAYNAGLKPSLTDHREGSVECARKVYFLQPYSPYNRLFYPG